jgi:hypothetical protein
MPKRCKFWTAGPLLAALLAFTCRAAAENRTTVAEAAHGPGTAPLVSRFGGCSRLALAKWLYARNRTWARRRLVDQAEAGLSQAGNPESDASLLYGFAEPDLRRARCPDATFGDTVNLFDRPLRWRQARPARR